MSSSNDKWPECKYEKAEDLENNVEFSINQCTPKKSDCNNEEDENADQKSLNLEEIHGNGPSDLLYTIEDCPPWYLALLLGFQQYLTAMGGTMTIPYLLAKPLCMPETDASMAYLLSTLLFVAGIVTLVQSTFGSRLPIIQGGGLAFIKPVLAILALPRWQCDAPTSNLFDIRNNSTLTVAEALTENSEEKWHVRMREIQGALIIAALVEVIVGFTGLVGLILRFITPITVAATISLIGLSLFESASGLASAHWGISGATVAVLLIFSQYMKNINVPMPTFKKKSAFVHYPLFKVLPVLLTIAVMWAFCGILTATGVLKPGNLARTDSMSQVLESAPWFKVPYPGQFGLPTFTAAAILGMIAAVFVAIIESVGNYYACARLAGAPAPPVNVINRGVMTEGIGSVFSGLLGAGVGVISFSQNVGAISITKVGSRRVAQYCSLIMIICGVVTKFGAVFVTIPQPVIGGLSVAMFGIISAVGISNLHYVDLNSSRNIFIFGTSIFVGLMLPQWLKANPGAVDTGSEIADQILTVLLSTGMLVGGFLASFLDNTIPGTPEETGLEKWKESHGTGSHSKGREDKAVKECYDMPFGMGIIERLFLCSYVPVSPTYGEWSKRKRTNDNDTMNTPV